MEGASSSKPPRPLKKKLNKGGPKGDRDDDDLEADAAISSICLDIEHRRALMEKLNAEEDRRHAERLFAFASMTRETHARRHQNRYALPDDKLAVDDVFTSEMPPSPHLTEEDLTPLAWRDKEIKTASIPLARLASRPEMITLIKSVTDYEKTINGGRPWSVEKPETLAFDESVRVDVLAKAGDKMIDYKYPKKKAPKASSRVKEQQDEATGAFDSLVQEMTRELDDIRERKLPLCRHYGLLTEDDAQLETTKKKKTKKKKQPPKTNKAPSPPPPPAHSMEEEPLLIDSLEQILSMEEDPESMLLSMDDVSMETEVDKIVACLMDDTDDEEEQQQEGQGQQQEQEDSVEQEEQGQEDQKGEGGEDPVDGEVAVEEKEPNDEWDVSKKKHVPSKKKTDKNQISPYRRKQLELLCNSDEWTALEKWTFAHITNPSPTEAEAAKLSEATGLQKVQVHDWFRDMRSHQLEPILSKTRAPKSGFEKQLARLGIPHQPRKPRQPKKE